MNTLFLPQKFNIFGKKMFNIWCHTWYVIRTDPEMVDLDQNQMIQIRKVLILIWYDLGPVAQIFERLFTKNIAFWALNNKLVNFIFGKLLIEILRKVIFLN